MLSLILSAYGLEEKDCSILPFGSGLINKTWLIQYEGNVYILQRINDYVFKQPYYIAENIRMVDEYLEKRSPAYLFPSPVKTIKRTVPKIQYGLLSLESHS